MASTAGYAPTPAPSGAAATVLPAPLAIALQHPLYTQWQPVWSAAYDVYEGAGGFLDPARPYLIAHPREWLDHSFKDADGRMQPNDAPSKPSPKLQMRRKLARYENVAA